MRLCALYKNGDTAASLLDRICSRLASSAAPAVDSEGGGLRPSSVIQLAAGQWDVGYRGRVVRLTTSGSNVILQEMVSGVAIQNTSAAVFTVSLSGSNGIAIVFTTEYFAIGSLGATSWTPYTFFDLPDLPQYQAAGVSRCALFSNNVTTEIATKGYPVNGTAVPTYGIGLAGLASIAVSGSTFYSVDLAAQSVVTMPVILATAQGTVLVVEPLRKVANATVLNDSYMHGADRFWAGGSSTIFKEE